MAESNIRLSATDETKAAFGSLIGNIKRTEGEAKSLAASFLSLGALKSSIASLGASLSVLSLAKFVSGGIEAQAALDDLSEKTTLSVEVLSQLQEVSRLTGADLEGVAGSASKFAKSVAEARAGSKEQVDAFNAMGISIADLRSKNFDTLFVDFAKSIANAKDEQAALAVGAKLAGKSVQDQLPFYKDLAREGLGLVKVTTEQAAAAEQLQNDMRRLTRGIEDFRNEITKEAVPALAKFTAQLRELKVLTKDEIFSRAYLSAVSGGPDDDLAVRLEKVTERILELRAGVAKLDEQAKGGFIDGLVKGSGRAAAVDRINALVREQTILQKLVDERKRVAQLDVEDAKRANNKTNIRVPPPDAPKKSTEIDALTRAQIAALPPEDDTGIDIKTYAEAQQAIRAEADKALAALLAETSGGKVAAIQAKVDLLQLALKDGKITAIEFEQALALLVDPSDKAGEAVRQLAEAVDAAFGNTAIAQAQQFQKVIDEINRQVEAGTRSRAQGDQAIENLIGVKKEAEEASDVARSLGLTFSSAFEEAISGGKGLRDILNGIGSDLVKLGTRKLVTEPLFDAFKGILDPKSKGGTGGGLLDTIVSAGANFLGFKAGGGPVMAGGSYIVGEKGPELFTPGQSGTIIPNGMGGGSVVFNISTPDVQSFRASQGQIMAQASQQLAMAGRRYG